MIKYSEDIIYRVIQCLAVIISIVFTFPDYSHAQQLVISEIMFNPDGNENAREYVEIRNLSESDLSLERFIIGDGEGFDTIIPAANGDYIVPAGSFALIIDPDYFSSSEKYEDIPDGIPAFTVDDSAIGNRGLSNSTAEPVYLISGGGDTLSVVNYSLDCTAGHSWEKIIPEGSDSIDNFQESREKDGSPGRENSVTPPLLNPALDDTSLRFGSDDPKMNSRLELFISYKNMGLAEISDVRVKVWILPDIHAGTVDFPGTVMPGGISEEVLLSVESLPGGRLAFNAAIVSEFNNNSADDDTVSVILDTVLPDSTIYLNEVMAAPVGENAEWIELYNSSESPVNLFNWKISDNSGQWGGIIEDHVFIGPKGYAVISGKELDLTNSPGIPDVSPVIVVEKFPAINNDGDTIRLFDFEYELADSMSFEDVSPGYSFELISVEMSSASESWDVCVDPSGSTPGALNSINNPTISGNNGGKTETIELTVSPNPFSDRTTISYTLSFSLSRVNLYVYDRRGRLISKIRDSEESGSAWTGTWDSRVNGSNLPAGPYILNLEALDKSSGTVHNERKTIVIGRNL
ncbi:lamin tail domain-containing protein [Candidatus Latescibacterota bacterium]